ncbi:MAG TPA: 4Fe-4S dicluster domain-containing protein [Solirubrobacteraceae bacterium]|nr:4Fe-4S dicluster domain-containing protein [Solirubrobacteraceae bacterium]
MIASALALAAAVAVAGGLFARRVLLLARLVRMGRPPGIDRSGDVPERLRAEAVVVVGQRKLLQRLVPGLMHAFIFWAFIVLFPAIFIAMIEIVDPDSAPDWGWYDTLADAFCVLALIGVAVAFFIRKVLRPQRFAGSHLGEADLILLWIAAIVSTLLALHATGARVFAWAHVLLILGFLAYLPHSKHLHIATAAINVYFGRTRSRGRLEPLRFDDETPEEEMRFGVGTVQDLTWKQMMDAFSCTECGRCQDACPAFATGKVLSPKLVVMGVRDHLFAEGPALSRGEDEPPLSAVVSRDSLEEMVWDCVTCGACVQACPVNIEHIDHIVDLRRHLVMVESRFPAEAEPMLRDVERQGNPWGKPQAERADWAAGLDVRVLEPGDAPPEVLYWVGCAASFDDRARESARSTAKLLAAAGVDFAILGPREACTGDPARRMGNEFVFQSYAEQNVATLDDAGVTKIVASCPHCFNTLASEYRDFGGRYEVVHHTELLAELVRDGRLAPTASEQTITYHDSCYLARHNDVRTQPRELAAAVGTPVEMERREQRTFCCGAGGAHMWMEERGRPINEERVREAAATGAETLAVACPFCTVMLDDGMRGSGGDMRVVDLATLLVEAVDAPPPA